MNVTINKANAVPATVTANNRNYDGTKKNLVTVDESTLVGGKMYYALGENATTAPEDNLYTTAIPAKTDAGTYYVWYKAAGDDNHRDTEEAYVSSTIRGAISYTVTFRVVHGAWDDGKKEDKTIVLTGFEGDELRLQQADIPEVTKPDEGYVFGKGQWSPYEPPFIMDGQAYGDPITEDTVYTYTYGEIPAATVTNAPAAKELAYSGQAQELVTAGDADGGTMVYAVGTDVETPPESGWSTEIPQGTEPRTYYVWYKAAGDADHKDTEPKMVIVSIAEPDIFTVTVTNDGHGTGAASPASGTEGTEVTLAASPDDGYQFKEWQVISGRAAVADNQFTIGTANVEIKAVFEAIPAVPEETKVGQKTLTEVPEELRDLYGSIEEIKQAMILKVTINGIPAQLENTALLDVELWVSTDGGVTWTKATEENFPEGGLTVILAYPEGTNGSDFDFSVSHMFTITSTRLGTTAGDIEYPSAEKTAEGLKVTLTGLSPVAVSWVKKDPGETPAPTDTPAPTATVQPVPKTGDSSTPALWLGLVLLGLLGIAGFCAAMARTAGKRR